MTIRKEQPKTQREDEELSFETPSSQEFFHKKIDQQWILLTEVLRREIIERSDTRKALLSFTTKPVSEMLPRDLLATVAHLDDRVAKLQERYHHELDNALDAPPIPEETMQPDLRAAAQSLTQPEYQLAVQRYRYARDVKMLALGAELLETKDQKLEGGVMRLPSGIEIVMDPEAASEQRDLLDPLHWQRRRQLKDRVYEITVQGRRYILKEKKTAQHTDTKEHGHKPGRTSQAEFAVAKEFHEQGSVERDHIQVTWERPIGCVTFTDGFQFSIFEFAEGLQDGQEADIMLRGSIIEHRDVFEKEYQDVLVRLPQLQQHPSTIPYASDPRPLSAIGKLLEKITGKKSETSLLSFRDYAALKAYRLRQQAYELLRDTMLARGYTNSDVDGYAFRVDTERVIIEIVGFDFEYFEKGDADYIQEVQTRIRDDRKVGGGFFWQLPHTFSGLREVTKVHQAAYLALFEREGYVV
ncbi:hypothetical protein HY624_02355 [Candidatus Uhrbacteria bacterium]|nr:hypothetical protein [Candidatus Uhrbacteria bacterium]